MAEMTHKTLNSHPCEDGHTKRRALGDPESTESESQPQKRRKAVPALTIPVNPTKSTSVTSSSHHLSILEIPHPYDTIHQLSLKLIAIAEAVIAGRSVAVATAFSATPIPDRTASKAAAAQMTPMEQTSWEAFTDGTTKLPEIDWDNNIAAAPTSPKSLKVAHRRAEALNQLYKTDRAHEGHVVWMTQNRVEYLPIIKAMARVIGAERNFVGGREGWNPTQFADLQSINKILSTAEQICQGRGHMVLSSEIPGAMNVLKIKRRQLQALASK